MKEIKSKIKAFRVAQPGQLQAVPPADVNPLTIRIERRPNGPLDAVSEKIEYSTSEGKKKVYVLISFLPVEGIHNGQKAVVERPIEFFYPVEQDQWIAATMRNLSLAARGGYVARALADLRKVVWDKGPVRCGKNAYGKPMQHDSEVAAVAWSIQQILYRRGFLKEDGREKSLDEILAGATPATVVEEAPATEVTAPNQTAPSNGVGECPQCQGTLVLMDGCPTCVSGCGYSKCG